jgi:transcriptional regulator with XRE-family HTH domain
VTARELLKWRKKNKCSQGILALILEVDIVTISRWERGVQKIPPFLRYALRYIEEQGDMVLKAVNRRKQDRRDERERREQEADRKTRANNRRTSERRSRKRRNEG